MWAIGTHSDENYYVLDLVRDRLNLAERTRMLFDWHRKWKPMRVGYEKVSMQADIEHIKSEMENQQYRFHIVTLEPKNVSKKERIRRLVPLFEQHKIWLPRTRNYVNTQGRVIDMVNEFIEEEYMLFDACLHDDMLDGLSWMTAPEMHIQFPSSEHNQRIEYDDTGVV